MRLIKVVLSFLSAVVIFAGAMIIFDYTHEPPEKILGNVSYYIDGDTLDVGGERIRLYGMDAPEMEQFCLSLKKMEPCGKIALSHLMKLTNDVSLQCVVKGKDRYNRLVAQCFTDDFDVSAEMVRRGYAFAYGAYENEEKEAKAEKRGLWNMEFEKPDEWRKNKTNSYLDRAYANPHVPLYKRRILSVIDRFTIDNFRKNYSYK